MKFSLPPILIAGLLIFSETALGHGTENHIGGSQATEKSSESIPAATRSSDSPPDDTSMPLVADISNEPHEAVNQTDKARSPAKKSTPTTWPDPASRIGRAIEDFELEDFPTLHPMVVHVPVIMIPLAFLFGLIGFFSPIATS